MQICSPDQRNLAKLAAKKSTFHYANNFALWKTGFNDYTIKAGVFFVRNLPFAVAGNAMGNNYSGNGGYTKLVHDKIFEPLHMNSSTFTMNDT